MGMPETTKPLVIAQLSAAVNKPHCGDCVGECFEGSADGV